MESNYKSKAWLFKHKLLWINLMKWNLEQISKILNAKVETICVDSHNQYFLWFSDDYFKFYLYIQSETETAMLAADPEGMPILEYKFNCNIIKVIDSPYDKKTKAIYFHEDKESGVGLRLAMNIRDNGNWYLWCNTWEKQ